MTQEKAPAGWYDDPAGSGGKRFWNGRAWTERVEGGAQGAQGTPTSRLQGTPRRPTAQGRIPDGYMLLNGRQVPIGGMLPQQPRRKVNVNGFVLAAVLFALLIALIVGLANTVDTSGTNGDPVPAEIVDSNDEDGDWEIDDEDWEIP